MKKLKQFIIAGTILLASPSCASYKYTTFEPCLPEDKDEINLKQRVKNYIAGADTLYSIESKKNPRTREKQLKFERKIMRF